MNQHIPPLPSSNTVIADQKSNIKQRQRQRATYSCDRCKQRKRACKRYDSNGNRVFDTKTECQICKDTNSTCQTTIARKKRTYFSVSESSIIQLKCLTKIVKAMFPEKDPNNFNDIQNIANDLYVSLPNEDKIKDVISSNEQMKNHLNHFGGVNFGNNKINPTNDILSNDQLSKIDSNVDDVNEIGLGGTERLFNALLKLEERRTHKQAPLLDTNNSLSSVIHQRSLSTFTPSFVINGNDIGRFVLLNGIPVDECRLYTEAFFTRIHESFYLFNEKEFLLRQEQLFNILVQLKDKNQNYQVNDIFSKEEVCTIYLVWLIGRKSYILKHQLANLPLPIELVAESVINDYVSSVNLCLSSVFFTNNLHAVRLLFLCSMFHTIIKNRNTAWYFMSNTCIKCYGLGYHNNLTVNEISNEAERENIKVAFWSAFQLHMNNCAILGRLPNISLYEIDLDLPKLDYIDETFRDYYKASMSLFKIMYEILENRKYLIKSKNPWKQSNYFSVLEIRNDLLSWNKKLPNNLKNYKCDNPKRFLIKLHLQYNYCVISLTTPYLIAYSLYPIKTTKFKDESVNILCSGIESAINTVKVIKYSADNNCLNGVLYYDLFYAYNSLLVLLLCYTLIKSKGDYKILHETLKAKFKINIDDILNTIQFIKKINDKFGSIATGVMEDASKNIKLLLKYFKLESIPQEDCQNVNSPFFNISENNVSQVNNNIYNNGEQTHYENQNTDRHIYSHEYTDAETDFDCFKNTNSLNTKNDEENLDHEDNTEVFENSNNINGNIMDNDFFGLLDYMTNETKPTIFGMNDKMFWDWNKLFPSPSDPDTPF